MGQDSSLNAPLGASYGELAQYWFTGSTALYEGMAVCFDQDRTGDGATSADATRQSYVELPSTSNNLFFAGYVARDYAAVSSGQMIEVWKPGSVCLVYLYGPSVTNNSQLVTVQAGGTYAGYSTRAGFVGEGTAVPLQTVDASSTATRCLCKTFAGPPSGLVEVVTSTGGANSFMVGGCSFIQAATTTEDVTDTLADATREGLRKKFEGEGSLGTYDCKITVTSGIQSDGTTALASVDDLDADGDLIVVEWNGSCWVELYSTGVTKA